MYHVVSDPTVASFAVYSFNLYTKTFIQTNGPLFSNDVRRQKKNGMILIGRRDLVSNFRSSARGGQKTHEAIFVHHLR